MLPGRARVRGGLPGQARVRGGLPGGARVRGGPLRRARVRGGLVGGARGSRQGPRFSIRMVIGIFCSDTETGAVTPPGVMQKK